MRVAIYTRVSTNQQDDRGTSLETQREGCLRLAQELGATFIKEFPEVMTGTMGDYDPHGKNAFRPQFKALREAIDKKEFDLVIAHSSDRLSRDMNHLVYFLNRVKENGADFRFVTEDADASKVGFLIQYIRGYANSLEHERIRERSLRGKEAKVKAGKPLATATPFGYQWEIINGVKERLIPLEPSASIVRQMFQDAANGKSMRRIAIELTQKGIPTTYGAKKWAGPSVRVILLNEVYDTGKKAFFQEGSTSGIEETVLDNIAVPLVSPEVAAQARRRIQLNKIDAPRNNKYPERTLLRGGFILCAKCNRPLTVLNRSYQAGGPTEYRTHCCGELRIPSGWVDEHVWGVVKQVVEHPDIIRKALEDSTDPVAEDLKLVDNQLTQFKARYSKILKTASLIEDEDVARDFLNEATLPLLKKSIKTLEEDREILLRRQQEWQASQGTLRDISEWSEKMRKNIDRFSYADKRNLFLALDLKVYFTPVSVGRGRVSRDKSMERINVSFGLTNLLDDVIVKTPSASAFHNSRFFWDDLRKELRSGKDFYVQAPEIGGTHGQLPEAGMESRILPRAGGNA